MLTKGQIDSLINEQFKYMQNSLNNLENYLEDVEMNVSKIGFEVGKVHKEFELLVTLLEIDLSKNT